MSSFLVESAFCIMDFNFVNSDDSERNWRRLRFVELFAGLLALILFRLGAEGICVFCGEFGGVENLPERLIVPQVQNVTRIWQLSSWCQPAQCKYQACLYNLIHASTLQVLVQICFECSICNIVAGFSGEFM